MILEVKGLTVHYGKAEALKGVSLEIREGEIVTLIGANGAGKTTTLRAISGLEKPSSGEIWFLGERIDRLPTHVISQRGIGHILEGRRVFAPMTVLENLEIGAYLNRSKGEVAKQVEEVYGHFPTLRGRKNQKAGNLSGGEQQMLATARALMSQPRLLLMDEPSLGLSPLLVEEVAGIIKGINKDGVSVMLIEQNATMALSLADSVYVLKVGEIMLSGNAKELTGDRRIKEAYLGG